MRKILVATRPENQDSIAAELGQEVELRFCTSLRDAHTLLDEGIHLIACGIHFGEGEMYDLLKFAKSRPETMQIPFLCVYGSGAQLSPAIRRSIGIATSALGADAFIDFTQWKLELGEEAAILKMRKLIRQLSGEGTSVQEDFS